jgi:peptide/nickel transport system substrate-binding protein
VRLKRRSAKLLAVMLGLALVAAACGNDDDTAAPDPGNGEPTDTCYADAETASGGDGAGAPADDDATDDDATTDDEGDDVTTDDEGTDDGDDVTTDDEGTDEGNDEGAAPVVGQSVSAPRVLAQDVPDPTEEITAEPSGELVLAIEQEPTGLNHLTAAHNAAWTAWTISDTHWRGAVYAEPDGTLVRNPQLVDSITLSSEDPQVVEYQIREDASWSDGTPVTANDFAFTWEAQRDAEAASAPAGSQGYEDMESVEGGDGKTVTVTFARPYADWNALFDYVHPAHYFESVGDGDGLDAFANGFNVESLPELPLVSSGPYVLTEYNADQNMILERNDGFVGGAVGPERIIGIFLLDSAQYPSALANNEFDVGYPQGQLDLLQELEQNPDATTEVGFGTFWEHLDFNFDTPALQVPEIRQAIALGLDRQDIVDTIPGQFSDEAEILNNRMFFPGQDDYEDTSGQYGERDVEGARDLLESIGCEDGDISLRLTWRDPNPRRQQTAEVIQDQLSEVGIDIELDPAPDFAFLDEGNFDIALFGWTGGLSLGANTSIYTTGEGQNFGGYSNPEFDQILADALVELDADTRAGMYNEADALIWEDLATIPLFQNPDVLTWNSTVVDGPAYNGFAGPTWNITGWTAQ